MFSLYKYTFRVQCMVFFLSLSMYLGIFETKMTHVVVDQAECKAPVHDGQAPLRKKSVVRVHITEVCERGVMTLL